MLAADDKRAAAEVITRFPGPASRPHRTGESRPPRNGGGPFIYRATFFDNVRINQAAPSGPGDQILIDDVDVMHVDFLLKQSGSEPTTRSAVNQPESATQPTGIASEPSPASQPGAAEGTGAPQSAATRPATQPAEQPVFVHWTGILRITPLQGSPPVPLKPGDSAVTMLGAPISIHRVDPRQQGVEDVACARLLYQTAGEKVWLDKSDAAPQILINKFPAKTAKDQRVTQLISTGQVEYSRGEQMALIIGQGDAHVPLEAQGTEKDLRMDAAWTREARFDFTDAEEGGQAAIRFGHLEGDVDVKHPRMALKSQSLDLLFDQTVKPIGPTTMPIAPRDGEAPVRLSSPKSTEPGADQLSPSTRGSRCPRRPNRKSAKPNRRCAR
jgi:hypothetical protein